MPNGTSAQSNPLLPFPRSHREWLAHELGEENNFEAHIADISEWPIVETAVHHPCMDKKLEPTRLLLQTEMRYGVFDRVDPDNPSSLYGYYKPSPGGNIPIYTPLAVSILCRKALLNRQRLAITHAFFYFHHGCAGKETGLGMGPSEGAKLYARFHMANELLYPGLLVRRPQLIKLTVRTIDSRVVEQKVYDTVWDDVAPFVLDTESLAMIVRLLELDLYIPTGVDPTKIMGETASLLDSSGTLPDAH